MENYEIANQNSHKEVVTTEFKINGSVIFKEKKEETKINNEKKQVTYEWHIENKYMIVHQTITNDQIENENCETNMESEEEIYEFRELFKKIGD